MRIPTEEKPSLRRVMQIALNSGQYLAECDRATEIPDFDYSNSGLDCLQTYLFDEHIQSISLEISDRLVKDVQTYFDESH